MIGALLFYALYPLSRYLTDRPSEASKKGLPPAAFNGTVVWHGGADTTRRFTPSETTMLDPRLSPSSGTKGETKERMKEQSPGKEDDTGINADEEQLMAVPPEHTENKAIKMSEMQRDEVEVSIQEDVLVVLQTKQNTKGESVFPTEDTTPEQVPGAQVKCPPTDDRIQGNSCPAQDQEQTHTLEESVIPAEDSTQEATCPVQKQMEILSIEESVTSSETVNKVTECWDEYLGTSTGEVHDGASRSSLLLHSLLADPQTQLTYGGRADAQTGWHFPAGPGLAEDVQYPLWQFPPVSYYPTVESTVPFEVMWRLWEEMDESATAAQPALVPFPLTTTSMDFTVMSYNILSQDLLEANQDLYVHCSLEVLDWSYRCSLLLDEIQKWEPDILCLQEVQENHYNEQLYPYLTQMGYTCVYKRRTGTKTDGCATCYRSACFVEVSVTPLEFFRPETDILDRDNVGIVLLLRPVVDQESAAVARAPPLCVANTHLLFNPRRGDVKLAQLAILLAEMDSMLRSCKAKGEQCNVVLCGDFNAVPHMPLYQLITTGELYYQGLPAWMVSGQEDLSFKTHCQRLYAPLWPSYLGITDNCQYTTVDDPFESQSQKSGKYKYSHSFMRQLRYCPAATVRPADLQLIPGVTDITPDASKGNQPCDRSFRHTISHRLDLESVYKHVLPGSGTAEVTTLHSEVGATVDYIFYSPRRTSASSQKADGTSEGLKLIGCLSLLSEDVLWSMKGLPNHIFPSDHLSLMAKFQLDLNAA